MGYYSFWIILSIFFWVLCAIAIILGMTWVYVQVQYYKWEKEDRYKEMMIEEVEKKIVKNNSITQYHEELDNEDEICYDE